MAVDVDCFVHMRVARSCRASRSYRRSLKLRSCASAWSIDMSIRIVHRQVESSYTATYVFAERSPPTHAHTLPPQPHLTHP